MRGGQLKLMKALIKNCIGNAASLKMPSSFYLFKFAALRNRAGNF